MYTPQRFPLLTVPNVTAYLPTSVPIKRLILTYLCYVQVPHLTLKLNMAQHWPLRGWW